MRVSVIGGSDATDEQRATAETLGRELANRDHEVICGGLTGVMEAVAKGTAEAGGRPIGIVPGTDTAEANPFIAVPIATGLGSMRNVLVVRNGDGVIAVGGHYGTLSEIAHALDLGLPVVGLETHDVEGIATADTPSEAVDTLEGFVETG